MSKTSSFKHKDYELADKAFKKQAWLSDYYFIFEQIRIVEFEKQVLPCSDYRGRSYRAGLRTGGEKGRA
jgi:hypothetical protein